MGMDRRLSIAMDNERKAVLRSLSVPGLGQLQALREIQAERLMRAKYRRA